MVMSFLLRDPGKPSKYASARRDSGEHMRLLQDGMSTASQTEHSEDQVGVTI